MSTTNTTAETTTPNIWRRRLASLVGVGYLALMCWFSYLVIFYDFTATNKFLFCLTLCAVSFAALSAMLYSRFQILTRLTSILLLPAILPQILLCFGQWELILPIAVTSLIIFFLSGASETVKTVFGVIYLLLYVLGSLAFFMLMSFFTPSTQQTILENGESPSGAYRYEIIQTDDSSGGNVAVHIEPNDRDIHLPFLTFVSNGYDRTVYEERPIPSEVGSAQWSTVSRADITAQLLAISEDVTLDLSKSQKATIGIPSDTETVYLKDLTDSQLEQLGVPAENDVLTFADKTCFRSYIAVLEDYFAKDNREISLFN
ncbi:hypothetical protein [Ruminococcus sp.]|uniref:hypothetical protein n=1 Tax=Ruminococcus sp. TaxID=41978 RepID=UPI0039999ED2